MSLWWLQPGWKDARCGCGQNIWQSGGDPDMGVCFDCHFADEAGHPEQQYPYSPICDICGNHEAVAGENGYGVCSAECDYEAQGRPPPEPTP